MRHYLCIWLLMISAIFASLTAQNYVERIYDASDGLPQQEIDKVFCGRDGKIWYKSNNHEFVGSFDGITWNHLSCSDVGLSINSVFFSESDDGIWFTDYNQLTLYARNGSWKTFLVPKGSILVDKYTQTPFIIDTEMNRWDFNPSKLVFRKSIKWEKPAELGDIIFSVNSGFSRYSLTYFSLSKNKSVTIIYSDHGKIVKYLVHSKDSYLMEIQGNYYERWIKDGVEHYITYIKPFESDTESIKFIAADGQLCTISLEQLIIFNTGILTISSDKKSKHLFTIEKNGKPKILLSDIRMDQVGNFTKDLAGNWWYGSSSGLVKRSNQILQIPDYAEGMISGLHTIGEDDYGKIWLGGYGGDGFCYFENEKLHKPSSVQLSKGKIMPGSYTDKGRGEIYYNDGHYTSIIKNDQRKTIQLLSTFGATFYCTKLKNESLAIGTTGNRLVIFDYKDDKSSNLKIIDEDKGLKLTNVLTISEDRSGRIWMGRTSQGAAVYDPKLDTVITWLRSEKKKTFGVISSLVDKDGDLWFGTNQGVYKLSQPEKFDYLKDSFFNVVKQVYLPGGDVSFTPAMVETKKYIIFSTNRGIHFLDKNTFHKKENKYRIFTQWYGEDLPSTQGEQNAILHARNGDVWIGTQTGALRIDVAHLQFDTTAAEIIVDNITCGSSTIDINQKVIEMPSGQRNVEMSWHSSGNKLLSNNMFYNAYIINSRNDTIVIEMNLKVGRISASYLSPDQYTCVIHCIKNNLITSEKIIEFAIPKLWTESYLFWTLIFLTFFSIPAIYIYHRQRNEKLVLQNQLQVEQSIKKIDQLKVESLSNYFNPHFINNALHWIQSRYRKDKETVTVIGRLADNIYKIYSNTEKGKVVQTLHEEMEIVKNYLMIAQVRFGDTISFALPSEEDINVLENEYRIPSMMLQIYTENAVEKGIANNPHHGTINIEMSEDSNGLHIEVIDDGMGRVEKVIDESLSPRKSSTMVMDELIMIYNLHNSRKLSVMYTDHWMSPDDNYPYNHGTKVNIFIPKNFKYDIAQD